MRKEELLIMQ